MTRISTPIQSPAALCRNNVAVGYQDGYWDNGRNWHQWSDDRHRQSYRDYRGNRYSDWNHDRDGSDGWRQNNSR